MQPSSRASATPSSLVIDIWVDAWISMSGEIARISRARPRSWTMTASTPAEVSSRTVASSSASSRGKDQRVQGHVALHSAPMQQGHHLRKIGPIEVGGADARVMALETEIDGIGAVLDRGDQAGPISGRRQQLGLFARAAQSPTSALHQAEGRFVIDRLWVSAHSSSV